MVESNTPPCPSAISGVAIGRSLPCPPSFPPPSCLGFTSPKYTGPTLWSNRSCNGKRISRPGEGVSTNGSAPEHLLATVGIGQKSSHPPFRLPFKQLVPLYANPLPGKRDPHSFIGMRQSQSRVTPSSRVAIQLLLEEPRGRGWDWSPPGRNRLGCVAVI